MLDAAAPGMRHHEERQRGGEAGRAGPVRLTSTDRPDSVHERRVQAADSHFRAAGMARSRELIESALASCPADRSRDQLGLIEIDARHAVGLILAGRSSSITERDRALLRGYASPGLSVHSYDWLVRDARKRKQNAQTGVSQGNASTCEECDLIRDFL
jgi:hypothetical protein